MDRNRREFLSLSGLAPLVALPLGVFVAQDSASAQRSDQSATRVSPVPHKPGDILGDNASPFGDPKVALLHNQEEMKQDIDKLFALVQQLKEQVDRTDSTAVLSLSLVDTAKKVEDLAKQIRNLARS